MGYLIPKVNVLKYDLYGQCKCAAWHFFSDLTNFSSDVTYYMCSYLYIYWIELLHQQVKMNFILVMPSGWRPGPKFRYLGRIWKFRPIYLQITFLLPVTKILITRINFTIQRSITNLQFVSSLHPTFVRLNDNSRCSNLNSWFLTYIHGMRWEYDDSRTNKRKLLLGGFISFYDLTSSSHFCRNQETRYKIYNIL